MITGALAPLPLRLGPGGVESVSPEQHARLCADLMALKRVARLATWFCEVGAGTAEITSYFGQNGNGLAYAPTATWNATGDVSFVWPSNYFEDDYEIQHPFKIRAVIATGAATVARGAAWELITRGVRIRTVNTAGTAANTNVSVKVW
jgi:hypothetical protein